MRIPIRRWSAFPRISRRIPAHFCWTLPALILCSSLSLVAPAASAAVTETHPQAHRHHAPPVRRVAEKKAAAPTQPPAPPAPIWPVNIQPGPARITWDSRGLSVVASNSSLADILQQISVATGIHVEGFSADQRIFGTYGPGPAREVLSELLSGSGYNVLILGGLGSSPPTRLVLSPRPTGPAPPAPPSSQESDYDNSYPADSEPQPPFNPNSPGFQPSPMVHTPQQIMEEMERRRQQMQQQQQQQQSNPDSPNN
jgi:hypothetical protein